MTFAFRAAIIAATTLTFAAGIGATAPGIAGEADKTPAQAINEAASEQVPTMAESLAALEADEVEAPQTDESASARFATLAAAVAAQDATADDAEHNCLAIGVYYESKGEPLEGQLAVAEVILNRTKSGRFPTSVCGVLTQRGQFSFVRNGRLPQPPASVRAWKTALAVAQVARDDAWDSRVSDALFFHARYVQPGWRKARVGSVGNHIFYR
ncbi:MULTISPECIES: cell wall hydrolase [unclassified Sphingomonas]|uniref:cell wall hydrolase n=1 Tax=unclassified Sphingomonas TaxID=196159 RepID=UPI0008378D72|nr:MULTISPECIES: cell wall hydrolase [unclassified Sphingomonas]